MERQYNMRSPAVKRLMREAQELRNPTEEYFAQPLEDNLFEWHFTVRGPPDSDFDGGIYHGRIVLPPEYPMKPPSIILLTPNGRFEINKKICLSISGHHPESWQPSWSIRTALLAIIGFMPTHGNGAIGSLDFTKDERQGLARKSQSWQCNVCGQINSLVLERSQGPQTAATTQEAKQLASQISFKGESERPNFSTQIPLGTTPSSAYHIGQSSNNTLGNAGPSAGNTLTVSTPELGYTAQSQATFHAADARTEPQDAELRRRNLAQGAPHFVEEHQPTTSPADSNTLSTVLVWVLSLTIAGLLFRRLFFL